MHLSETAYLVAESRARSVSISRDIYAAHWIPEALRDSVRRLWEEFAECVYPHDDVVLGVRNRFFLERLSEFAAHGPMVFVNIAAGFTSYPFLLDKAVPAIELDLPAVVGAKASRMKELQRAGFLDRRPVEMQPVDLNNSPAPMLSGIAGPRSFILVEGLSYYLSPAALDRLWTALAQAQAPGSILAMDYWPLALREQRIFDRVQRFFERKFEFPASSYNLIELDRLASLEGYRLVEATNVAEQARVFAPVSLPEAAELLPEHYVVLERI